VRVQRAQPDVADADMESDEIPTSYVPFRNANLLSMATSYAEATDSEALFIGAHSEDFSGTLDCRPPFSTPFNVTSVPSDRLSTRHPLWRHRPQTTNTEKAGRRRLVTSFY